MNKSIKRSMAGRMTKEKVMARWVTLCSVRNSSLEDIHAGKVLPKKYLEGYSRITESEIRELMLEIESNIKRCLYTIRTLAKYGQIYGLETKEFISEDKFVKAMREALFGKIGVSWDDPTLSKS